MLLVMSLSLLFVVYVDLNAIYQQFYSACAYVNQKNLNEAKFIFSLDLYAVAKCWYRH